jgi:hypothetical protein
LSVAGVALLLDRQIFSFKNRRPTHAQKCSLHDNAKLFLAIDFAPSKRLLDMDLKVLAAKKKSAVSCVLA